ncbi:hypothetical protein Nepgr_012024 [Nepenthes gracilis]|uniref:Secreted protein n=1 Tax=Nepenthes gracilis TaxID=150966 RepID=A0AAD3XMH8_NEPGR|nr:hypothetical protein Nepgr_012024 [Nepenthes gracilis]
MVSVSGPSTPLTSLQFCILLQGTAAYACSVSWSPRSEAHLRIIFGAATASNRRCYCRRRRLLSPWRLVAD